MRRKTMLSMLRLLAIVGMALLPAIAVAQVPCSGHKLLPTPRPELSCNNVKPKIYPSPDGTLRAVVYPVDISLHATPDMESRVVIRSSKGETLTSKDYSSPRGANGYYIVKPSGRRTRSSSSTACRRRAVIRPGLIRWRCTVETRTGSRPSAT